MNPPVWELGIYSWHHLLPTTHGEHFELDLPTVHTSKKQVADRLALLAAEDVGAIVTETMAPQPI
jgi:hypothetical protein